MPSHYGGLGPSLVALLWAEMLVGTTFVVARCYTRICLVRKVGWEDWLTAISLAIFLGFICSITASAHYGLGQKMESFPPTPAGMAMVVKAAQWEIIGLWWTILGNATSKAAVAVFLLRIVVAKWHKYLLWWCLVSNTLLCLITFFIQVFSCIPVQKFWNPALKGHCWVDTVPFVSVGTSYNAALDFILAILPWFVVWKLQMKREEKLIVAIGLSLGAIAGIGGIVRVSYLKVLDDKQQPLYVTIKLIIWTSIEAIFTIICASIPVLRPFWGRALNGSTFGSALSRSLGGKYSHGGSSSEGGRSGYVLSRNRHARHQKLPMCASCRGSVPVAGADDAFNTTTTSDRDTKTSMTMMTTPSEGPPDYEKTCRCALSPATNKAYTLSQESMVPGSPTLQKALPPQHYGSFKTGTENAIIISKDPGVIQVTEEVFLSYDARSTHDARSSASEEGERRRDVEMV